jgi:hypothetical protein
LIKNNLKALFIHLTISFICFNVFLAFISSGQPKWVSEEAALSHHYTMILVGVIMIAISVALYYFLGRKFLANKGSSLISLCSTTLPAILGIFLWIIAFSMASSGPGGSLLNSELWGFYTVYNGYSTLFLNEVRSNNPYLYLLFCFIPTIAMWIGLLRKRG